MNANTNEKQSLLDLAIYAFNLPRTKEREAAFYKLLEFSTAYSHHEEGQLTSMLIDSHFDIFWKSSKIKMSGIGYVSTYPEFRGNGAIRKLMTQSLQENYKHGVAISYLAPFSYQFYGKFGYAYSFDRKIYAIPSEHFPKGQQTKGKINRHLLTSEKIKELYPQLKQLHEQAYNQGSLARSKENWDYYFLHKSQPQLAIYQENNDEALGYLLYEFVDKQFKIKELITSSPSAKNALYRFISSHAGQFSEISWTTTPDIKLEHDMLEPAYAQIQIQPYMQARIVNLDEFLKVNGNPSFSVQIIDDIIPENNQTIGQDKPLQMTIGEFTARVLRENQAILREYF